MQIYTELFVLDTSKPFAGQDGSQVLQSKSFITLRSVARPVVSFGLKPSTSRCDCAHGDLPVAFLRTAKRIYNEAVPVLYEENEFVIYMVNWRGNRIMEALLPAKNLDSLFLAAASLPLHRLHKLCLVDDLPSGAGIRAMPEIAELMAKLMEVMSRMSALQDLTISFMMNYGRKGLEYEPDPDDVESIRSMLNSLSPRVRVRLVEPKDVNVRRPIMMDLGYMHLPRFRQMLNKSGRNGPLVM